MNKYDTYPIFSVLGLEIEYMLVDKDTLAIQPKSDLILKALADKQVDEYVLGNICISNELVLHVLELKNPEPKPIEFAYVEEFQNTIQQLQVTLDKYNLLLLPTGAHPWMNPYEETYRWPYGSQEIYQQFDKIFDCRGHGWSNLQSMHVNLPFANDEEFCQLHNMIRVLLPILPALSASSPILDGKYTGFLDARLNFYGLNQKQLPSISGDIIPEYIRSQKEYEENILIPMYNEIAPFDQESILQEEWLNSRAAIPKFERMSIEIRILDTQECVNADIAIAKLIYAILKNWYRDPQYCSDNGYPLKSLKFIYEQTIRDGFKVNIEDKKLLHLWQLPPHNLSVKEVWSLLIEKVSSELDHNTQVALETILKYGSLSERILKACNNNFSSEKLLSIYRKLSYCLLNNQQFINL